MIKDNLMEKLEQLQNGDIDYSEAGEWLFSCGWDIVKELDWLREMLEK